MAIGVLGGYCSTNIAMTAAAMTATASHARRLEPALDDERPHHFRLPPRAAS